MKPTSPPAAARVGSRLPSPEGERVAGRRALLLLAVLALAVLAWIGLKWTWRRELRAPLGAASAISGDFLRRQPSDSSASAMVSYFRVRPGEGAATVANHLERSGLIRHAWVLRRQARRGRWDRHLVPGWYPLRPGDRVQDLFARLAGGEIARTRLVIPEGWNLRRILAALAESTWTDPDSLLLAARDARWLAQEQVPGPGLEGYLFPDTYLMPKGESPRRLLEQMLHPGLRLWQDSLEAGAAELMLDRRKLWTLASVIEMEAAREDERPMISAVFWNRLRSGMRLESDPTVQFALGRPPGPLTLKNLEVVSEYNTYRVGGLPPGPICSPGRASLFAALRPRSGFPALFFVARGDGSHVFSRTLEEHNRARRLIRRGAAPAAKS